VIFPTWGNEKDSIRRTCSLRINILSRLVRGAIPCLCLRGSGNSAFLKMATTPNDETAESLEVKNTEEKEIAEERFTPEQEAVSARFHLCHEMKTSAW
jgi:hypothetical protein